MLKRAHWFGVVGVLAAPAIVALCFPGCQGTCATSDECPENEFCSMSSGVCVSPRPIGFCKPIPTDCPSVAQTACGCDGKTYANACVASLARQSLAEVGECNLACGGIAKATCASGTYCHYEDGICGSGDVTGSCQSKPTSCENAPQSPVCGCDKVTYASLCEAQAAGVSVASAGACPCGGPDAIACPAGRFCSFDTGMCAVSSATGTCVTPPADCGAFPPSPVCGCDSQTYDSACLAAQAQVSVYSTGACPCGGPTQIECPLELYCDYGGIGSCLNPNPKGTCAVVPASCNNVQAYVCGCDGKTYLNACFAAQGGTSVAATGECKSTADGGAI